MMCLLRALIPSRLLPVLALLAVGAGSAAAADVRLAWDPNGEADLAGYVVVYGTVSKLYTQSVPVAAGTTEVVIANLSQGATYFFAVRAVNAAGMLSGLSNEVSVNLGPATGPAPTIVSTAPPTGPVAGGTPVTIAGTNFVSGAIVRFGVAAAIVQSLTATSIVAVAPAQAAGVVPIAVTNPDGQVATRPAAFTYLSTAPAITGLSPTSGSMAGDTLVTITGTNFTAGSLVHFGSTAVTPLTLSTTTITVRTPPMAAGPIPVSVLLPSGAVATASGSFTALAPMPIVSAVGPAWGPTSGGTAVTITGTQFLTGATVLFGATPATVTSVAANVITVTAPAHGAGLVSVSVVNLGGVMGTRANAFAYQATAPTVTSVVPNRGPVAGGNTVVVTGQSLAAGATVAFDGTLGTVLSTTATTITVRVPPRPPSLAMVTVRNPDGRSGSLANAYTFDAQAPVLTTVSPATGPTEGGTVVSLGGSQFAAGAAVTIGGVAASVVEATATTLRVVTPAGAAGAADVTVRNPDGLEARLGGGFTYDSPPKAAPSSFVRYFAEGAQGSFFATRFALANPHTEAATVTAVFTDPFGQEASMTVEVPAGGQTVVDRSTMPTLANEAFATRFESDREIGIDRTVIWDVSRGYGAHSETGIVAPRTTWYFAEGATHSGFDVFYLLQNPGDRTAEVLVRYMLGTGQVIDKVHYVAPFARTNIWVNHDDPALRAAEVSAQLVSLNDVPIVAERSMYQSQGRELFTAGHNSAGIAAPSTRWFLAEGATGDYFDMFVLIANPAATPAQLDVTYLRADGEPLTRAYTVAPNSRFTIWVDHEDPRLRNTDVSVVVAATNDVPVIVERTMWWPGHRGGPWTEAHNSAGATTTAARWVLADGISATTSGATTYALVANTGETSSRVRFTLLTPTGRGPAVETVIAANRRFSLDVPETFVEARNSTFGLLVESLDGAPLVVERASYWNAGGVTWAAGTDSLAMPLSTDTAAPAMLHRE